MTHTVKWWFGASAHAGLTRGIAMLMGSDVTDVEHSEGNRHAIGSDHEREHGPGPTPTGSAHHVGGQLVRVWPACTCTHYRTQARQQ